MPPNLQFSLFRRLEASVREPGDFMDAAIEYVEYARDANDLLALAQMSRTNGNGAAAATDYLDRRGRPRTTEEIWSHHLVGYDRSDLMLKGMRDFGVPAERDWFATRCENRMLAARWL